METNVLNQFESSKLSIENGILFCTLNHTDCYLSESRILTYLSKIEEITKGKPVPFVIDVRKFVGNFSPTAAKLFADSPILKTIISQVFIADTLNGKLLISSYSRLFGNNANIRIFNQMEAALAYCVESQNLFYADKG
jgi:hypothetical protein